MKIRVKQRFSRKRCSLAKHSGLLDTSLAWRTLGSMLHEGFVMVLLVGCPGHVLQDRNLVWS